MYGARVAAGVVDAVLQLHDAPWAIGGHQFRTAGCDETGLLRADPLAVLIVIDRVGPSQTAAGPGILHLDKFNLGQTLEDQTRLLGDAAGTQVTGSYNFV